MTAPLRKGWCPGALRPMEARDGLLVRLRLTGGIVRAETAHALADLAETHGNGLFDLSARANLQMRGVRHDTLPALQDALSALGALDANAGAEAIRNVIASPLAGLHCGLDIRPLVAALEESLVAEISLHALPGKFGFLIDDGSWPSLADIAADVRFEWTGDDFALGVGGTRDEVLRIGRCEAADLVATATRVARGALTLFAQCPRARRMRDLLETCGGEAIAEACGVVPSFAREKQGRVEKPFSRKRDQLSARDIVGLRSLGLGLAAPFGRLDAGMLRAAADVAAMTPSRDLRLTPWRALLIPGARISPESTRFITDPADPRLAVIACVGATGCARGSTDTHADAAALADIAVEFEGSLPLHVSGCEKGCAKPSPSPVTLVGRGGRYDLVRNGRAGDLPHERGLDLEKARETLAALLPA